MKKLSFFLMALIVSWTSFAQTVPTQEELWASFKTAAGLTTLGTLAEITEAGAGKPHNDPNNQCACRIICAKLLDANVNAIFALPEWAWLKAYIMTVQSGLPEASSSAWRYAIAAFFLQSEHSAWPASADFSEAGKPENWGPYYLAAQPKPTYDVTVTGATVSTEGQNIILSGKWEEKLLTVSLWQEGATKGFGTYATEDYGPIFWGTAELTPTSEGVYTDNGDNTFTFTATATDAEGGIYNISVTGAIEQGFDWIPMPLEIANLTTEVMEFEGVTYLQLMGRNDMEGADVMLFLNNYTGEEKTYEVNVANSYMTFGGLEVTVMDGSITKSFDPEKGDVFAGTVHASAVEAGETRYVEFALTMYALPPIAIELADVEIVVNEKSAIAFFNATWEGSPLEVEVSGFEEVEFKNYSECWISIGDDVNWVDAARGPATITIENGVASLEGTFSSYATGKTYNVTLSGTLPQGPGTGLDNVQLDAKAVKVIKNGMFIINLDGKEYNAQGTTLK